MMSRHTDFTAKLQFRSARAPAQLTATSKLPSKVPSAPSHSQGLRLFDAYAAEVARVDSNSEGVLTFVEADFESTSDGGHPNSRLFLSPTQFHRFAVTREINDGPLAPRFAPVSAVMFSAVRITPVSPSVPASAGRDGDDR
jgi:hypothetical protein